MRYSIIEGHDMPYAEVMTEKEFLADYGELSLSLSLLRFEEKVRHCKADIFERSVHGSLSVPSEERGELSGRFYMDDQRLLFITENDSIKDILNTVFSHRAVEMTTTGQALFAFLDALVRDEGDYIDDFEEALNDKESQMLEDVNAIPEGFEHYMQKTRKSLLRVNRYYEQMADMAELLAESPEGVIDQKARRLYRFLSGRMDRLSKDALNLRAYSSQIYDMYQSRINIRQNKVMQFLTVITTIFMPLTLITGWYGMNFKNMPEIDWQYGYISVIGFSLLLIVVEYIIFKKKKWM